MGILVLFESGLAMTFLCQIIGTGLDWVKLIPIMEFLSQLERYVECEYGIEKYSTTLLIVTQVERGN